MATYTFLCEATFEGLYHRFTVAAPMADGVPDRMPCIEHPNLLARRDYRSDAPAIDRTSLTPDHVDRVKRHQHLFLPEAKDFAGPGDPDGIKGLKNWQDQHQPRPSNKKPAWPTDAIGGARTHF